jgi:hypothetical protein
MYTKDLMKKFNTALDPDENGKVVDQREYKSMISSLLYLTVTRLDI